MPELDTILAMLESQDADEIRESAYAAGEGGYKECIPLLARHLQSQNLGVQEAADQALRLIGGAETVQAVVPLLRSDDAPVRNLSMDILREVGGEDVASLTQLLEDEDPDIRIFVADILGSCGGIMAVQPLCRALLKDPEVNVRYQAAVSLGNLEEKKAAACLNQAMADEEWVQFAVIEALTKLRDESSVNALAKAMDKSSDLVCSMIVDALAEMGNLKAVTLLLRHMDSSPTALRNKIVKAIVHILGGRSLTMLTDNEREHFRVYALAALQDEDPGIQDAAAQGLAFVGGEQASASVLQLAERLEPVRDQERILNLAECLASIGVTQALHDAVLHGTWKAGMVAVKTIELTGDVAAGELLLKAFWDKDREMQRAIIDALAKLPDPGHRDFYLDILERHNDGHVLKGALRFLGFTSCNPDDGEKLFSMLEHPYDDVKEAALEACVNMDGPEMRKRFQELFQSPEPIHRFMATYALGRLGAMENLEELKLALEDEVPDVRKVALESLGPVCNELGDDFSLMLARLSDEVREVRLAMVQLMGSQCCVPGVERHLLQALDDEDDWVRIRAVEALGERADANALPSIVPLLESDNKLLVLKVIQALGAIGGKTAFRSLLAMVDSDDPEMQEAAEEALARIKEQPGEGD